MSFMWLITLNGFVFILIILFFWAGERGYRRLQMKLYWDLNQQRQGKDDEEDEDNDNDDDKSVVSSK